MTDVAEKAKASDRSCKNGEIEVPEKGECE